MYLAQLPFDDFSKVTLIPSTVTDEVSALKSKQVDSIWIFYAWAGIKTELEDLETDYFAFADIDPVLNYLQVQKPQMRLRVNIK